MATKITARITEERVKEIDEILKTNGLDGLVGKVSSEELSEFLEYKEHENDTEEERRDWLLAKACREGVLSSEEFDALVW